MQPTDPKGPNPNYDFILKDPVQPKAALGFRALNLSAINSRLGLVGLVVLVLVLFGVLAFGHKNTNSQGLVDAVARSQEIARVSALVVSQASDPDTKNLAETAQTSMLSQQQQLLAYLKTRHVKVSTSSEAAYKNSSTDSKLTEANQAGNLDSVYKNYLKTSLSAYQNALSTTYPAVSSKARVLLNSAYQSNQVIVNSL